MRYSMELGHIMKSQPIFDFDYEFYDESLKSNFEKKFIDYFYFREIGFETIGRFKKRLQTQLNVIMPYYVELYHTTLRAKNIDFLLNKDLVETYTKEVDEKGKNVSNGNSLSTGTGSKNDTSSSNMENIEKNLDTPQGSISNLDNYLSGATKSSSNDSTNFNTQTSDRAEVESNNTINDEKKLVENYSFSSKGNIGVTSSAELLEKWRKTIINIDKLILDECESLFMLIY